MNTTHWSKQPFHSAFVAAGLLVTLTLLGGCQQDVVHQRSMAELNQKAQTMMQSGDVDGAIARLEAAHDLDPNEPNTTHNLAVAYQTKGDYDKAIALFTQLMGKPGMDKAELYKALGVTYEAKADQLAGQAKEALDNPKADKVQTQQLDQQAEATYAQALSAYQQAIASGLKNPAEVQKQIEALQARKKNPAGSTPQQP
jgi:tetratricopeptide (TPR) repeat protein